jgi:nucleotide-binding universal stress UspA family protein
MSETFGDKPKPVVVCLDGSDDGERALRYGIEEARRRGTSLRLVHVTPDILDYMATPPTYDDLSIQELGERILAGALEHTRELMDGLHVESSVLTGHRVASILKESEDAATVVLGTRAWKATRAFGGSTTVGVASRAHSLVTAVPPSWTPGRTTGKVLVGLDAQGGPGPVLERAFEAARERAAELTILHAWTPPHPYLPAFGDFDSHDWQESTEKWLAEQTDTVRAANLDVPARIVATYSVDKSALTDLAGEADLLVLGRHRHTTLLVHRLGSVAHHALHSAPCPVEIVPIVSHD